MKEWIIDKDIKGTKWLKKKQTILMGADFEKKFTRAMTEDESESDF